MTLLASLKLFLYISSFNGTPYCFDIFKSVSPLFAIIFVSALTSRLNIDRKKIHEEFKIPDTYQIIGMITAGVEDSNTDISKNKHNKKKLIHNEFFSK